MTIDSGLAGQQHDALVNLMEFVHREMGTVSSIGGGREVWEAAEEAVKEWKEAGLD